MGTKWTRESTVLGTTYTSGAWRIEHFFGESFYRITHESKTWGRASSLRQAKSEVKKEKERS